jgi:hypothetical protein
MRTILAGGFGSVLVGTNAANPPPAAAFDNAIGDYAKYADKPKRRGTPPKDLGVSKRTVEVSHPATRSRNRSI